MTLGGRHQRSAACQPASSRSWHQLLLAEHGTPAMLCHAALVWQKPNVNMLAQRDPWGNACMRSLAAYIHSLMQQAFCTRGRRSASAGTWATRRRKRRSPRTTAAACRWSPRTTSPPQTCATACWRRRARLPSAGAAELRAAPASTHEMVQGGGGGRRGPSALSRRSSAARRTCPFFGHNADQRSKELLPRCNS